MTTRQRISAWIGGLLTWAIVALDYIDRVKAILELPGTARSLVSAVGDALGDTSWQAVLIFLIGVVCLLFATSHLWVHWLGWTTQPAFVQQTAAEPDTSIPKETPTVPDLSIGELFYHLAPNWKTMDQRGQADVAQRVRDALALDLLKSWGRPVRKKNWIDEASGPMPSPPPEPIEPQYWRNAEFTYRFMTGERRDEFVHAEPTNEDSALPSYTEIQVSAAQAGNVFAIERPPHDAAFLNDLRSTLSSIHSAFEQLPSAENAAQLVMATAKVRGDLVGKGNLEASLEPLWEHLRTYAGYSDEVARLTKKAEDLRELGGDLISRDEESLRECEHFRRVARDRVLAANDFASRVVNRELVHSSGIVA